MTNNKNEQENPSEKLPENVHIIEQGIDIEAYIEYLEFSHSFEIYKPDEKEMQNFGNILFCPESSDEDKKRPLAILAHTGTISAYELLSLFHKHSKNKMKLWAEMALQECRMFLESDLADEERFVFSTGLGGDKNSFRCFLMLLPANENLFTKEKQKIIENEFNFEANKLKCKIESFEFHNEYAAIMALIPFNVALGEFMDNGIKNCNEFGNFVLEEYYATNGNVPCKEEIEEIIKIIKDAC